MNLEFEIFDGDKWKLAGNVEFLNLSEGFLGASVLSYDLDYWMENAAVENRENKVVRDHRAASIADPVNLENHYRNTWPPFILDLLPGGYARSRLARMMGIQPHARSTDVAILLFDCGSPVGNVRIKPAVHRDHIRLADVERFRVSKDEIFEKSDRFLQILNLSTTVATGLQGEWPKVAMTRAKDGLYYPDPFVEDDDAIEHVIVKLPRSNNRRDEVILRAEAIYSMLAEHIGLNVYRTAEYRNGVLIVPRFDRKVRDGRVDRLGQESFVSAANVAEFGYLGHHETYIKLIKEVSAEPFDDVLEYVKREAANQALGNSDNHGRNTAFSKSAGAGTRISPLFDFAPMRLALEGVARSTRWHCMLDKHSDHAPDWRVVSDVIFPEEASSAGRMLEELGKFSEVLREAPRMAKELGADEEVLSIAMARCDEIVRSLGGATDHIRTR